MPILPWCLTGIKLKCALTSAASRMKRWPAAPALLPRFSPQPRGNLVDSPVDVTVQSGETLRIYFTRKDDRFEEIYLEGKVKIVYQGFLFEEAYK